ncbi:MAG TPA: LytR C-terminal domain-containing protein [Candidatus Woesebacteria bacterium]|nr:LytR C-terminal domain-containing protein [Candidatus Woesebacteria bacterium]
MKNFKIKRKINLKLILGIILLLFLAILMSINFLRRENNDKNLDYKLGIIANDGITLVSISTERKMINVLNLGDEASAQFKNVLEKEEDKKITNHIFWYNFGFFPDKILNLDSVNSWKNNDVLIKNLGFLNWIKYKKNYGKMLLKQEKINGLLKDNGLVLDEILVRDFSESKLNNEELRLSVFNNTDESGLASFMAKRLEWSGFSVVSTDNDLREIDNCLVIYGKMVDKSYGWKMINKIFDCEQRFDESLNENELEIYFGDNLASMIKYSNY